MAFALCSCAEKQPTVDIEKEIKQTVSEHIRRQFRNPDSFNIESIEIKKDTIPYYFNNTILSDAEDLAELVDDYNRYCELGSYWRDEQLEAAGQALSLSLDLLNTINTAKEESINDPMIEYIVCLRVTGENAFGVTVSNNFICVVDNEDLSNVLCVYDIDNDFIKSIVVLANIDEDFETRATRDRFGNYDRSKLSFVEQFILCN